jgi:L-ascorbate metabolism protein UlaG (beta-lactamase superfamily)
MDLTLLRHATLWVDLGGRRVLVDPMLDPAEARPPIEGTPSPRRNPLVPLPIPAERCLDDVAAVVVTHTHADHLDRTATRLLPRELPLLCQPEDVRLFAGGGFADVRPMAETVTLDGVRFTPTGGLHGAGELDDMLGPVCGVVLQADGEPTLYVAGDTIWCSEVEEALQRHRPDAIVVNAGAARLLMGGPIVMDADQVVATARAAPDSVVIAVHMEAINHCELTRAALRERIAAEGLEGRVFVPEDGERLRLG